MKPGDIHWVELPPGAGHEQVGRRPGIVLQSEDYAGGLPLLIVVPLTSATAASRFVGTLTIEPDSGNGLRQTSIALVFQIRAVDRRVVQGRIGSLSPEQLAKIFDLLDRLTGRFPAGDPT